MLRYPAGQSTNTESDRFNKEPNCFDTGTDEHALYQSIFLPVIEAFEIDNADPNCFDTGTDKHAL